MDVETRGEYQIVKNGEQNMLVGFADEDRPGFVTLQWDGKTDVDQITDFFQQNCPHVTNPSFGALIFSDEKIRLDNPNYAEVKKNIPANAAFVRLEHIDLDQLQSYPRNADFVVWARVDLKNMQGDVSSIDNISVWAKPAQFKAIGKNFTDFVAATAAQSPAPQMVLKGMNAVLAKLEA